MDPLRTEDLTARLIAGQLFEPLLRAAPGNSYEPNLARRAAYDETMTRLTLWLRTDVRFHNGERLRAEHVVRSLSRAAGLEGGGDLPNPRAHLFGWPTAITATSDSTVEIRLPGPHEPLLRTLTSPRQAPILIPAEGRVGALDFPVGTGPYRPARRRGGEDLIVLERFDGYWGKPPAAGRIEFHAYEDAEQALAALENGAVDLDINVSSGDFFRADSNPDIALVVGGRAAFMVIGMNNGRAPLDRVEARRALALALDRAQIVNGLFKGAARVTDRFIGTKALPSLRTPTLPAHNTSEAARLVEALFPPDRRTLKIIFPPTSSRERWHWLAEILEAQLNEVGLRLSPVYISDFDEYTARIDEGEWDISLDGLISDTGDPFDELYVLYGAPNAGNSTGLFRIPGRRIYDLLLEARGRFEPQERIEAYRSVLDEVAALLPCVPLAERAMFAFRSKEVEPFKMEHGIFIPLDRLRKTSWDRE